MFATEKRAVEWVKNPVPFKEAKEWDIFKCPEIDR